jgi:hypothetical protein
MKEPISIERLQRLFAHITAMADSFTEPYRSGIRLAIEESCCRLNIEEPSADQIRVAKLAIEMTQAIMPLVEKGEYEIVGTDDIGENLYRKTGAGA